MTDRPPASVWRGLVIYWSVAAVFAVGLGVYMFRVTRTPAARPLLVPGDAGAPITDALVAAERIPVAFVAHVAERRFDSAYALMARSYRDRASLEDFRKVWSSPLLAAPQRFRVSSSRARTTPLPGGGLVAPATFTTRGVLVAAAGGLDVSFTLAARDEGGEPRVLAMMLGGVPILQAITP